MKLMGEKTAYDLQGFTSLDKEKKITATASTNNYPVKG